MKVEIALLALLLLMSSLVVARGTEDDIEVVDDEIATTEYAALPPWKCCNKCICDRSARPTCRCLDVVRRCYRGCKKCVRVRRGWYTCKDTYKYNSPPFCKKCPKMEDSIEASEATVVAVEKDTTVEVVEEIPTVEVVEEIPVVEEVEEIPVVEEVEEAVAADPEETSVVEEEEEGIVDAELERPKKCPWKCCNSCLCTKSKPARCQCNDKRSKCWPGCKKCVKVPRTRLYVCKDTCITRNTKATCKKCPREYLEEVIFAEM